MKMRKKKTRKKKERGMVMMPSAPVGIGEGQVGEQVWYGRVWVGGRMLVSMAPGPVLQGVSHSITMDGRGMG